MRTRRTSDKALLKGLVSKYGKDKVLAKINNMNKVNEGFDARVYPEDYTRMETADEVIEYIDDMLRATKCYESIAESIYETLDHHDIFDNKSFRDRLCNKINESVWETYQEMFE